MLSKHPLDLVPGRKLSKEEIADALRLSITAELDAVSLYLQLARAIDDEKVRKVFEDIAREEKTHVGEFLALLKSLDPEQVEELKRGAEEVGELTGVEVADPPSSEAPEPLTSEEWGFLRKRFEETADGVRVFRRYLPFTKAGRGTVAVLAGEAVLPLCEISVKFSLSQRAIDYSRATGQPLDVSDALRAATELALAEDRYVLEALEDADTLQVGISGWDAPGAAVEEVANAAMKLAEAGATPPYVLFVSPARFAKLVAVHEKTGVMELNRVKALVRDVVATPVLPEEKAVLVSATPRVLDLVVGADMEIEYMGPEDGRHVFRAWETLALRVRFGKGIAVLKQG